MSLRLLLQVVALVLPWDVRRRVLNRVFGYRIHPTARIGLSVVAPSSTLTMGPGSRIGHLNVIRGMDTVELADDAAIGRLNWIYGIPVGSGRLSHGRGRRSELLLETGAAITNRHLVDCSDTVRIGALALVAGYGTQIITHAIDIASSQQSTRPVTIGRASMVGTRCVILGGAELPPFSALGAGSTLRNAYDATHVVYSGVPATPAGSLPADAAFFSRTGGYVG